MAGMPEPRTAYLDLPDAASGPAVSKVERALLAETLTGLGPDQPTLCEGWTTHHLAAHLKLREGDPIDEARSMFRGDAAVEAAVGSTDFETLVRRIAEGPPWSSPFRLPKLEPVLNSLEYFVHHEDVRRAQPDWQIRDLPTWAQDQLWNGVVGFSRMALRRSPVSVRLERTDNGAAKQIGKGDDPVVVRGLPGELALYLFGRREVADVELSGPDEALAAFTRRDSSV